MTERVRARVEKLAPTGEGVVRTREGVGLVAGALPGEDVEAEVLRVSRKIWHGRAVAVASPAASRLSGGHADGCSACDWAHFEPAAAREAKRALFLETMSRIGRLPAEAFGELPIEPSDDGYRLRSRLHAARRGGRLVVGAFAPRSHSVEPLDACIALAPGTRALLNRLADAVEASGEEPAEIAMMESLDAGRRIARLNLAAPAGEGDAAARRLGRSVASLFDGVRVCAPSGRVAYSEGEDRLWLSPAGRDLPATADAFFQSNRFLVGPLAAHVREAASQVAAAEALDLFGGVGLFAGALLDAGHAVTSVESHSEAADGARLARARWNAGGRWRIERAAALDFALSDPGREDVIVVDPPRGGLGLPLARALAARGASGGRLIYVSCDPATLARDLAAIVPLGWEIRGARLFDLFALTHRVEAVVVLDRKRGA